MHRRKTIQLQGSTLESIIKITNDVRMSVSKVCLGVDDMHTLGNQALVLRAEIYPEKLHTLYAALLSIGIKINEQSLPDVDVLQEGIEYPLSIQITSLSTDTDRPVSVPKVPG